MKIDFTKKFTNFDGKPLVDQSSQKELSLGDVCVEALLAVDQKDPIDGVEKVRRYSLATEIYKGNKESLSAEEAVLLKELVGKYFTTMIVGQALPFLDSD